jgi:ubiquitin conjugation factor E4 B
LVDFAKELQAELDRDSVWLGSDLIERALVARLSLEENGNPVTGWHTSGLSYTKLEKSLVWYLIECWKRAHSAKKLPLRYKFDLSGVFSRVSELCVSYIGLLLQIPDMFPQPTDVISSFSSIIVPALLVNVESDQAFPPELLDALVIRFADDGLDSIFSPILLKLSADIRMTKVTSNFAQIVDALRLYA